MTSKKIITNRLTVSNLKLSKKLIEYNEDSDNKHGISLGLSISIVKSNTAKSSGVKHVFFPALLDNHYQTLLSGSSHVQILNLESKSSQGISIKNFSDTTGDNLPYVYMGNTSPYPDSFDERFAPFLKFSELGVIENIKKEDMFLVYDDTVNEYDHKNYINKQQNERGSIYPTISGSRYSSIFEINSTIEPFEIRNQLFKTTVGNTLKNSEDNKYRNFFSGITVDIVGPHVMRKHGSNITVTSVIDKLELKLQNNAPYNDSNQKSNKIKQLKPLNYDGKYEYTYTPYDEKKSETYLDGKYNFASGNSSINDLVYGNNLQMSEIGTRYESATAGFIYESTTIGSTTLGTDSIAFGGLKGDSSSLTSGIESDTKRRKIKQIDKQGGHYPTIARTGDSTRKGNFNIRFDDRNTVMFNKAVTNLEYPQLKPFAGSHPLFSESGYATPNSNTGAITTTGNMISGITDNITLTGDRYLIDLNHNKDLADNGEVNNDNITSKPFDESRISLGTSVFYMTGTTESILPGFSSRLHDKTHIVIDISSKERSHFGFTKKSLDNSHDVQNPNPVQKQPLMGYYNRVLSRWESIGGAPWGTLVQSATASDGRAQKRDFLPSASLGFTPMGFVFEAAEGEQYVHNATLLNDNFLNTFGRPTKTFGFPHAAKYHATSSHTYQMSDYIDQPFLLEKVIWEFNESEFEMPGTSTDSSTSEGLYTHRPNTIAKHDAARPSNFSTSTNTGPYQHHTFFIMRQFKGKNQIIESRLPVKNNLDPESDTFEDSMLTASFRSHDRISRDGVNYFSVTDNREMVTYSQATLFHLTGTMRKPPSSKVSIADLTGSALGRDANIIFDNYSLTNGLIATSSLIIEAPVRVTPKTKEFISKTTLNSRTNFYDTAADSGTKRGTLIPTFIHFGDSLGGRSDGGLESSARALASGQPSFAKGGIVHTPGGTVTDDLIPVSLPDSDSADKTSPYILFPEDEIFLGYQYPAVYDNARYGTPGANASRLFRKSFNGRAKLTLIGSLIKNKSEFHDSLNQNLTTLAVHEAIHYDNPVLDQFLVATEGEYSGSYMDTHVTGGVGSITKSIIASGENVLSASIQRFRGFDNKEQRFYDTVLPDLDKMFVIDGVTPVGLEALGGSDSRVRIAGVNSSVSSAVHNFWYKIFPFEPRYNSVTRKLSQFFMFFNIDATNLSTGVYGIRSPFSFLGQDNVIAADILGRIKNTNIAAFSFGSGPNNGSFVYKDGSTRLNQPVGLKYGILNYNPQFTKNIFRGDKFGQRADMLEQSQDSRFLIGTSLTTQGPIRIRFVVDDDDNDQYIILDEDEITANTIESSNLSIYATSSLPFFDDDAVRNRSYSDTLFANRVVDIIGFNN